MLPGLRDKILILPATLALAPANARAITAFASRGGVVIADTPPGPYKTRTAAVCQDPRCGPGLRG